MSLSSRRFPHARFTGILTSTMCKRTLFSILAAMLGLGPSSGCGPRAGGTRKSPAPTASASPGGPSEVVSPPPFAPSAPHVVVDGMVVWDEPIESLSPTGRAYLQRLERLLAAYATAPRPPVTFAADRARFQTWLETTGRPWFSPYEDETRRLVEVHPRAASEPATERRFHVIVQLIELYQGALYLHALVGGPPGHAECPDNTADAFARTLAELARDADRCASELTHPPRGWASTAAECQRRGAWARALLATAPPMPEDYCLEDMPRLGR